MRHVKRAVNAFALGTQCNVARIDGALPRLPHRQRARNAAHPALNAY
jgi:hypothetical protein